MSSSPNKRPKRPEDGASVGDGSATRTAASRPKKTVRSASTRGKKLSSGETGASLRGSGQGARSSNAAAAKPSLPRAYESSTTPLGDALRQARTRNDWSMRDVSSRSQFNSGYLSLLERGEVKQPTPQVLRRLAGAYEEPFELLMRLAGYIEDDPDGLSPNARRALSLLGPNPTDDELEALKTILGMLRKDGRSTFTPVYGLALAESERQDIRRAVLACLREADAIGVYPTPLDELYRVAELAQSGEIQLSVEDRKALKATFGEVAMRMLRRLQGVIDFRSNEVWVNPALHPMKQRFVQAHEAGHKLLEWQRDTFAFLDDTSRLRPDVKDRFERQANEAAIELLAQGGRLREEADDDNPPTIDTVQRLGARFGISLQATARYVAERSSRACACALAFKRDDGALAPHHLFCSESFEQRLAWKAGRAPHLQLDALLCSKGMFHSRPPLHCSDVKDRSVELTVGMVDTPNAAIAWFAYKPQRLAALRG